MICAGRDALILRSLRFKYYIIIAQDDVEVFVYDRASDFSERRIASLDASPDLPALGISLPLRKIYENTGVGEA